MQTDQLNELRLLVESRPKGEGQRLRLARMLGMLTTDGQIKANIPEKDRSKYSQIKYQFFLEAPFEISQRCCAVIKKDPAHRYAKGTGRHPMTAQMASESMLRTQQWLKNGCNGFHLKSPVSNPMAFWTEQDVLLYLKQNNIPIASVYGDIVVDYDATDDIDGQMSFADLAGDSELFDLYRPLMKTAGCDRTGCFACMYGAHLEKPHGVRFQNTMDFSSPKLVDWQLRGGRFDENGLWKPSGGLGYWFILEWLKIHGNIDIWYPNREYYIEKYSTDETRAYLGEQK